MPSDRDTGAIPTLKRTLREFREDNLTDWAAALTYYGLLALFPGLIAFAGIFGLIADPAEATRTINEVLDQIGPDTAAETFAGPIESVTASSTTAGLMALFGIGVAIWSASAYVGAFIRASNTIYEQAEGRSFWKLRPLQLLITLVILVLAVTALLGIIVSGPLATAIGEAIGLSDAAVTAYQIAKWPVLAALVVTIFAVLYYASPNAKIRGLRWVTPGGLVALGAWIVISAGFALYVANFGSYEKTYGTLGGVIVLLVWLWLTNVAILFGHQLNAERERSDEIAAGIDVARDRIQLAPREPAEKA